MATHFENPLTEQRELAAGNAAILIEDKAVIAISGADRLEWLHSMLSQNFMSLTADSSAEALLLDANGRIEQIVHAIEDGECTWLITEMSAREGLLAWFAKTIFRSKVVVKDSTDEFAIVGSFHKPVGELFWQDPWMTGAQGGARYSNSTHEDFSFFETLVPLPTLAVALEGKSKAGSMALDALRVAAHRPAQSNEVDDRTLPHELDLLSTAVHLSKGCYRGQESVAKVHNLGHPPRRLVMLHLDGSDHSLPNNAADVSFDGKIVGRITTAAQHFEMGPIALAVVARSVPEDAELLVADGNAQIQATQEVIVPQSAGQAAGMQEKRRNLLGGSR